MAIMASKGPEEVVLLPCLSRDRDVRSVVLLPRRSPAPREEEVVDWIWEAEYNLGGKVNVSFLEVERSKSQACKTYFEHAIGNSHEPGTVWITIFDSLTPDARSLAFVPARRGSMIANDAV